MPFLSHQSPADEAAEAKIYWILLNAYRLSNRSEQALEAGERSLALARKLNLREQLAFTSNDLPHIYHETGRQERAIELVAEASRLWRELDNLPMLADSLATASMISLILGDFDRWEITSHTPPSVAMDAIRRRIDNSSAKSNTPPNAAIAGTDSCTVAASVPDNPLSAVYQIAYPIAEATPPERAANRIPCGEM